MLLLRCSLIRISSLLDVDDEFGFSLIPVYRTRWIVHFIVLQVIARALPVRPARSLARQSKPVHSHLTLQHRPSVRVLIRETTRVVEGAVSRPGHCVRSAELTQERPEPPPQHGRFGTLPMCTLPRHALTRVPPSGPSLASPVRSLLSPLPKIYHYVLYVPCVCPEGDVSHALQVSQRRCWTSRGVDYVYIADLQGEEGALDYADDDSGWHHPYIHICTWDVASQTAEVEGRPHRRTGGEAAEGAYVLA